MTRDFSGRGDRPVEQLLSVQDFEDESHLRGTTSYARLERLYEPSSSFYLTSSLPSRMIDIREWKGMTMTPAETAIRRTRLDHDAVLTAAEALLDAHGIDSITMTMLASELGTKVSSLYNHVASLDDLRSELQIRVMRQLGDELRRAAMGTSGAEGLRTLAETFLRFARTYPHRYDAMTRPILDREKLFLSSADVVEALTAMVGSAGVPKDSILNAQAAFFAALHGYNALESSGFFAPDDGRDIDFDAVYAQLVRGAVSAMLDQV